MKQTSLRIRLLILLAVWVALSSCAQNSMNIYPLEESYLNPQRLSSEMSRLNRDYPGESSLHIIGFSGVEGIPISALRIGNLLSERKILVIGQHHGDEVLGIEVAHQIALDLLADSPRAKAVREDYQVWIVPTINPEGWRIVRSGSYQWKRKNNFDSDQNGVFDLRVDGVDLNRNYPVFWAEDKLTNPADPFYKGKAEASEQEVQAVITLAEEHEFEIAVFYHSSATGLYSEKIYSPAYTRANEEEVARIEQLRQTVELYASQIRKDYRNEPYDIPTGMSSRVGNARNFFFHTHGTKAFLVEIGGINKAGDSVIHPPRQIMQFNREQHSRAFLNMLYNLR